MEIKVAQTSNSISDTLIDISHNINNAIESMPKEVQTIALIALGSAIGTKFPKTTLFLGGIWLIGKLLDTRR